MKCLCRYYYGHKKLDSRRQDDMDAIPQACAPYDEATRKTGQMELVGSLAFPKDARTICPTTGGPRVTAGPHGEAKESTGAFFVDAADIDEAVTVASKHPGAHLGTCFGGGIAVHPCAFVEQP